MQMEFVKSSVLQGFNKSLNVMFGVFQPQRHFMYDIRLTTTVTSGLGGLSHGEDVHMLADRMKSVQCF